MIERFWDFMIERERIRQRRLAGQPQALWTMDPIFAKYSFTNVKRIHDRTTAIMKREVYDHHDVTHPSVPALVTATAFRFFGKHETALEVGWLDEWNPDVKAKMIERVEALSCVMKIFTGAYIIPSCSDPRPKHLVVADIIDYVHESAESVLATNYWETMTDRLKWNWGVGSFMAKEVLLDYMIATNWRPEDWSTWTPVGPGARRGATYETLGYLRPAIPETDALDTIIDIYAARDEHWPKGMVDLDLTDIQFQLCEWAKYVRVRDGGSRPKRKFRPTIDGVTKS